MRDRPAEPRKTLPAWTVGDWRVSVDLPHLLLVTGIAGWCAWYWFDSYRAASDIENMSLIEPSAILALVVYGFVLRECVTIRRAPAAPIPSPRAPLTRSFQMRLIGTMLLLAAFVAISPYAGFDIASFVYVAATLAYLGERRIWVLLLLPAVFCVVAIYSFNTILATPLPLFFGGDS